MAIENVSSARTAAESKLKELLLEQLKDIYWAEKKLAKALTKMQDSATSIQLKDAFANHREQTRNHISRLEQVFTSIGEEADSTKCPAMAGIIDEANDIIDETDEGSAQRDAALIIAAQKAEHYEIATYGGLAQLAETLGLMEAKQLLGQTLEEEKQTDELLSQLAKNEINIQASQETGSL
jgi:ferritin-like metal-binding protein YciE